METVLKADNLTKSFGERRAVDGVSFKVAKGEIVGVVGPNGAGKSTLFDLLTGVESPDSGEVFFMGERITGIASYRICRMGVARTFQQARSFPGMSALENVMVGALFTSGLTQEEALGLLNLVDMGHKAETPGRDLTLSEQRRLDLARALATRPKLLLLDEVAAGLSPVAVKRAVELVERVRSRGLTVMVVDHFLSLTLKVSDRIIALDQGRLIAQGTPGEVMNHPEVLSAYLGVKKPIGPADWLYA